MRHLFVAVCGVAGLAAALAVFAPGARTATCVGTITAHTLTITGNVATGTFTVAGAGCELKVGLATYKAANGQPFPANLPQALFDSKTGVFGPGQHTLSVNVPACFAQTDMFTGDVIGSLSTSSSYGARLLDARLSGSTSCTPVTTTTTPVTTTQTTTVTTPAVTSTVTVAAAPVTTTVEVPGSTTTVTVASPPPTAVTTTVTTPAQVRTVTVKTPARTVTVTRTIVKKAASKKVAKKCRSYRGSCHPIIRGKG